MLINRMGKVKKKKIQKKESTPVTSLGLWKGAALKEALEKDSN